MIQIYATHMEGGATHQHIAGVKWFNPETAKFGASARDRIVEWVGNTSNRAFVCDGSRVGAVDSSPPYIRTHADGKWTDNLLALRRY